MADDFDQVAEVHRKLTAARDADVPPLEAYLGDPWVTPIAETPKIDAFHPHDLTKWRGDPPARLFAWEDWIPARRVTSLYGAGGVGKSLIGQQLHTAIASERGHFLGVTCVRGRIIALYGEDDEDELWRRQQTINTRWGIDVGTLNENARIQGRAGKDSLLAFSNPRTGTVTATPFYDHLREQVCDFKPALTIIDNIGQVFMGNENDRFQVTQFCRLLERIAIDADTAVLLMGHPAKVEGSKYSGSTAWDAAVRSRLLLERNGEDGEVTDYYTLKKLKANYAGLGEIPLKYSQGMFIGTQEASQDAVERIRTNNERKRAREALVARYEEMVAQGLYPSHQPNARAYYLPGQAKVDGIPRTVLINEFEQMVRDGVFTPDGAQSKKGNRHVRTFLGYAPDRI